MQTFHNPITFRTASLSLLALALSLVGCASAQRTNPAAHVQVKSNELKLSWDVMNDIDAPESAYYEPGTKTVYVSNVAGKPTEKDGKGWISKIDTHGRVLSARWVSGLNAPKGMRAYKNTLYVTDINQLVAIDMVTGKITRRLTFSSAKFLNDIAIDDQGTVYISDMRAEKIFTVKNGKIGGFVKGEITEAPNGLLYHDGKLIVAGWGKGVKDDLSTTGPGHLFSFDIATKKKTLITKTPLGNLDGLEVLPGGDYLVSDWVAGKVYRVSAKDGKATTLLEGFKGAADIGYIAEQKLLLVPRMMENRVTAFVFKD